MNRDDFLSIDAIRFGLDGLQKNFRFFAVLMIIVAVLYNLPTLIVTYFFKFQILDSALSLNDPRILIPQAIISMIIYLTVELGLLGIALKFRDNAAVGFKDLFRGYPLLIKYLVATIIFWLMILLPFLLIEAVGFYLKKEPTGSLIFTVALLISLVPVAYLFLKYQFYGYFIVDKASGPLEALRQSGRITEGALKNLFIFWLEMDLCIAFALGMASIFIAIIISSLLQPILEQFVTGAGDIASLAINLFVAVPATKLATADIYRRREWRSATGPIS